MMPRMLVVVVLLDDQGNVLKHAVRTHISVTQAAQPVARQNLLVAPATHIGRRHALMVDIQVAREMQVVLGMRSATFLLQPAGECTGMFATQGKMSDRLILTKPHELQAQNLLSMCFAGCA